MLTALIHKCYLWMGTSLQARHQELKSSVPHCLQVKLSGENEGLYGKQFQPWKSLVDWKGKPNQEPAKTKIRWLARNCLIRFQDFRRAVVRNRERAGMPERVDMMVLDHMQKPIQSPIWN